MLHNIDSDTDISKIELSEQLPLQSDIDHLSNLDIELDDDEKLLKDYGIINEATIRFEWKSVY